MVVVDDDDREYTDFEEGLLMRTRHGYTEPLLGSFLDVLIIGGTFIFFNLYDS